MAVTCDEGVYRIAREIILQNPRKFKNLVLCIGSFHMIKVVMACLGKYLEESGAEPIWTQNLVFGVNVVQSVLSGTHYTRSLKGLCLLSECVERLQWCEFFSKSGIDHYLNEMCLLQQRKEEVAAKNRDKSKTVLDLFAETSDALLNDFKHFRAENSSHSESVDYWDKFIQMVHILRDLIRADREGDWKLHLHSLKVIFLFAAFNRTNYLRWCSLYVEDMQKLPETAPDIYIQAF
jgi:hypothetical protein